MGEVKNMDIGRFVNFINGELQKDKTISVNRLCEKLNIKKSTLKSKMSRGKYSYNHDLRQYIKNNTTDSTIEVLKEVKEEVAVTKEDNTYSATPLNNIDIDRLNLLLDNLDSLLELVAKKDNTNSIALNSDKTRVTSLRINEELYEMIKSRAIQENKSISDIVNRSLLDYLNNCL
jgi:hypothetical protein